MPSDDPAGADRGRRSDDHADDRREADAPPTEEAPLADLAAEVAERSSAEDPLFEDVPVDVDIDETSAWEELFREDPLDAPRPSHDEGSSYVVDDKMCHACPYFGDPPALHCEHDGTEIVEVVDTDHYLVVDCPMVDAEHAP